MYCYRRNGPRCSSSVRINKKLGLEDPALGRPGREVTTTPFETRLSTIEDSGKDFELSEPSKFSKSRYLRGAQGPEVQVSWGGLSFAAALLVRFLSPMGIKGK